jgi:hypothetical protein
MNKGVIVNRYLNRDRPLFDDDFIFQVYVFSLFFKYHVLIKIKVF